MALDIGAVIDALDVTEVALAGAISLGPAAIQHAVDRPETVTELVLFDTGPVLADLPLNSYVRATDALVDLGVVPSLGGLFPSTPTEDLPALERLMRASLYHRPRIEPRDLRNFDVTEVLTRVEAPTLVVKSQDSMYTDMTQTRALLSGIPGAELRMVPGTMAPWLADRASVAETLVSFLTDDRYQPEPGPDQGMMTVVFTDLVSSTEVLESAGDVNARSTFKQIEVLATGLGRDHGGRVVKALGDGLLLTFTSTRRAISFALELQEAMSSQPVGMRIGMAAGEPIQEDGDVHGAVVAQASRIANLANAGEVIVSDSVRQLAIGKEFRFDPKGEVHLRGFEEAQRVWMATRATDRSAAT